MPESGEPQGMPVAIARCCRRAAPPAGKESDAAFDWQDWRRISCEISKRREPLIILGLSVVGIAGVYVLVKRGKVSLACLRHYLQAQPKDTGTSTNPQLGECKFGFQDV